MILFDSMVIIYALGDPPSKNDPNYKDVLYKRDSSRHAIENSDVVCISAISYVEVGRGIVGPAAERFADLYQRLNVLQVDAKASFRALEILNDRKKRQSVCRSCLSAKESGECRLCKRHLAGHQRIADALIVATADTNDDIDTLYTYDRGITELSDYVKGCKICPPPGLYLDDLFKDLHGRPARNPPKSEKVNTEAEADENSSRGSERPGR